MYSGRTLRARSARRRVGAHLDPFVGLAALVIALAMTLAPAATVRANAAAGAGAARVAHAGADQVIVSAFSEKGDFIARGVSSVYWSHWANVDATTAGIYLAASAPGATARATFAFEPVAGQLLTVATYDNLQRASARSAGFAGINVTGPGEPAGCARLTGSFRIWDLAADAAGTITRLDLTYVEHCGAGRPSNFGEVLINDAPHVGSLTASAAHITFPDQTPTLPYQLNNSSSQPQGVALWQSATSVSHFSVTTSVSCTHVVPAHATCTYLLRLLPPRPGTYRSTLLVTSSGASIALPLSGTAGGV
ncbi:MAG: hypothetical protein KGI65_09230 [Acidobacteriota bacterium]|nr:hypothetical protein [Acidobacteriota bacterium]